MGSRPIPASIKARRTVNDGNTWFAPVPSNTKDGGVKTAEHDLVVLSLGMVAGWNPEGVCNLSTGNDAFIKTIQPKIAPTLTDMEGIFVAGVAAGPKDIVDTIVEAGAAAMEASNYLTRRSRKLAA